MEKTDQGIVSHLLAKRVFRLFFDSPLLLKSLFCTLKIALFQAFHFHLLLVLIQRMGRGSVHH